MTDFDEIFTRDLPLIDVRAPVEFEAGHFPKSINLPILENEERRLIGIRYKEKGQEEAVRLGHEMVSGAVKEHRLSRWISFLKTNPDALLYCYRGGLRSKTSIEWLSEAGVQVPRIEGGYKALRNHLLERMSLLSSALEFLLISGKTGSGKTRFINKGFAPFLDLELLASHRGSSFGARGVQPAQATFENSIAISLLKLDGKTPILIEDESVMIGSLVIPEVLFSKMKKSPVLLLEVPILERARNLAQEYVLDALSDPKADPMKLMHFFTDNLLRIRKKLGGLRHSEIDQLIRGAFQSIDFRTIEAHEPWIRALLESYYDPLYEKSIERAQSRIQASGSESDLARLLKFS